MTTLYTYLGGGALYHVPARDLTEQDLADFREVWKENGITEETLINSGLYEKADRTTVTYGGSTEKQWIDVTLEPRKEKAATSDDELEQRLKDIEEIDTPSKKRAKAGK